MNCDDATTTALDTLESDCDATLELRLRQSLRALRRAARAPWRPWAGRGSTRVLQREVFASMSRETAARNAHQK